MVRCHHHMSRGIGPFQIRAEAVPDLVIPVGPAGRRGMHRFGKGVQPPLGVERDNAEPPAHVHDVGSRTAVFRHLADAGTTAFRDAPLSATDRLPSIRSEAVPVVVPWNEDPLDPGLAHHVDLRIQPTERLALPRGTVVGNAAGVHVVTQEDDHPLLAGGAGQVTGQRTQHRLALRIGGAGITDENQRGLNQGECDRRHRSRNRRRRGARGRADGKKRHPRVAREARLAGLKRGSHPAPSRRARPVSSRERWGTRSGPHNARHEARRHTKRPC